MKNSSFIIDGLAHVNRSGKWIDGKTDSSLATLLSQMKENGVSRAILTALPGQIDDEEVIEVCRAHPKHFIGFGCPPIASEADLRSYLVLAREKGLVGVKLHPRLGRFRLDSPRVIETVGHAVHLEMPIILCGFPGGRGQAQDPLPHEAMAVWADRYPTHPFILAHAGSHRILDAWHMARARENVFLDLSHTLHYYRGSSVEKDIGFVAKRLDSRVLFGSDFPETSIRDALGNLRRYLEPWPDANHGAILGETWGRILERYSSLDIR